jgi:hypothetical protein
MNRQAAILLIIGISLGTAAIAAGTGLGGITISDTSSESPTTQPDEINGTSFLTDNGTLTLQAASEQVIRGQTALPAGTTITIRLRSTSSTTPFLRSTSATVADNGTFRTTIDLSQVTDQPEFVARVRHNDSQLTEVSGQVVGTAENPPSNTDPAESDEWELVKEISSTTVNASFRFDGDQLTLPATSNASLQVATDGKPGTNVSIRLQSVDSENPFLRSQAATVNETGIATATYNMSTVAPGTEFEASISYNDTKIMSRMGTVES